MTKYITYVDYDGKHVKIPIPKNGYWWTKKYGASCVIGCNNTIEAFYITDKGHASIGYCDAHARSRILEHMITGVLQRGVWCQVEKGRLEPHDYYKRFIKEMKATHPKQAVKLKNKLKKFK